ncbi:hypothetical protein LTR10_000034 [Elasticomyces elasticus]|nr:hypothetical protein LTR10_000034 [Elasticomyces elasticus]KAK4980707.1 hypothetical protein LTR42_001016 [Elasticomyces elasticus]
MADHAPSRFLALPAELRVRIYECLFEAELPQLEVDISLVKDHAPEVAIVAVSRLIRREALAMAQQAVSRFFGTRKFFLDLHEIVSKVGGTGPDLRDAHSKVKALPRFLLPAIELRFRVHRIGRSGARKDNGLVCVKIAVNCGSTPGQDTIKYQSTYSEFRENSRRFDLPGASLGPTPSWLSIAFSRGGAIRHFDVEGAVKTFFDIYN